MGFLTQFEKLSEKLVEGLFKGRSSTHVQPVEIAKKLAREMSAHKTISVAKIYVPNEYEVRLNSKDWDALAAVEHNLATEMESFLTQKAAERMYFMVTKPKVHFISDTTVNIGEFAVVSRITEQLVVANQGLQVSESGSLQLNQEHPEGDGEVCQNTNVVASREDVRKLIRYQARAEMVVIMGNDSGMTFKLSSGVSYIGRRGANQIYLDDPNVSRCHAQIEVQEGNYIIIDLESTNGTIVNGKKIKNHKLISGDHIRVGTTELEFRMV